VTQDLGPLTSILRTGSERFQSQGAKTALSLLDFWRWSTSDLVSNATRGVLAEFIVATALGIPITRPREEWAAWDLTTPEGTKVEVKSAAYIQSWSQEEFSEIAFKIPKTRTRDPKSKHRNGDAKRQADVYVLSLLAHKDKATINPLNLDQWTFFILPTAILDARTRSQHSITLPSLLRLHGPGQHYGRVREMVAKARRLAGDWKPEAESPSSIEDGNLGA